MKIESWQEGNAPCLFLTICLASSIPSPSLFLSLLCPATSVSITFIDCQVINKSKLLQSFAWSEKLETLYLRFLCFKFYAVPSSGKLNSALVLCLDVGFVLEILGGMQTWKACVVHHLLLQTIIVVVSSFPCKWDRKEFLIITLMLTRLEFHKLLLMVGY